MQRLVVLACAVSMGLATWAMAHGGVKNPAVMARMMAMEEIGKSTKLIGSMAKGELAFDDTAAKAAIASIAAQAERVPALFEAPETDPKSEALPAIWENFSDFTVKAQALETAARDIGTGLNSPADLKPALAALGSTCKSCHRDYRKE